MRITENPVEADISSPPTRKGSIIERLLNRLLNRTPLEDCVFDPDGEGLRSCDSTDIAVLLAVAFILISVLMFATDTKDSLAAKSLMALVMWSIPLLIYPIAHMSAFLSAGYVITETTISTVDPKTRRRRTVAFKDITHVAVFDPELEVLCVRAAKLGIKLRSGQSYVCLISRHGVRHAIWLKTSLPGWSAIAARCAHAEWKYQRASRYLLCALWPKLLLKSRGVIGSSAGRPDTILDSMSASDVEAATRSAQFGAATDGAIAVIGSQSWRATIVRAATAPQLSMNRGAGGGLVIFLTSFISVFAYLWSQPVQPRYPPHNHSSAWVVLLIFGPMYLWVGGWALLYSMPRKRAAERIWFAASTTTLDPETALVVAICGLECISPGDVERLGLRITTLVGSLDDNVLLTLSSDERQILAALLLRCCQDSVTGWQRTAIRQPIKHTRYTPGLGAALFRLARLARANEAADIAKRVVRNSKAAVDTEQEAAALLAALEADKHSATPDQLLRPAAAQDANHTLLRVHAAREEHDTAVLLRPTVDGAEPTDLDVHVDNENSDGTSHSPN